MFKEEFKKKRENFFTRERKYSTETEKRVSLSEM